MKSYAIIGLGRFGESIALELAKHGQEVLVVDCDEVRVQNISDRVTRAVCADLRDVEVLRALNVCSFDFVVVCMGSDISTSVLISLNLKECGAPCVITKASSEAHRRILEKIGVDKVIFPEQEFGEQLARNLCERNVYSYVDLSPEFSIVKMAIPKSWGGRTLIELNLRQKHGVNILAVRPNGSDHVTVMPPPDQPLCKSGLMTLLGSNDAIEQLQLLL